MADTPKIRDGSRVRDAPASYLRADAQHAPTPKVCVADPPPPTLGEGSRHRFFEG